ncbi:dynamin GTPase, partial [Aureobasidium melanogenum]
MFALASQKSASRLEQIATLRARGIGNHIDLPQLVVSGDQSAGKSSVLEGLTGLPFPRQDGLCTRFATEILLHHDDSRVTKIEASLIPASGRDRESLQDLTAYKRTLKDLADLPDVISDAGELMGVRGFGKITLGPSFSRDLLKIKISGPVGLHLSIVDLPGIILVPNEEQTEDDVDIVHDLVDQYLKNPRTIILAVVQAGNDIANQGIIRKSREFDVDGERTVGIITKPDLINDGSEKRIALLARNQDTTKLKLGCFLLKTPSPSELDSQIDAKGRESRELSFFQTSPWKEQNLDKDRTGIGALRHFLQKLLDRHIEHELPKVREEIESLAVSVEQKLLRLGAERVELTEMRLFLTRLAMKFHNITTAALSGDYHDTDHGFFPHSELSSDQEVNRLRARVHQLNMGFSHTMREDGQKRKVVGQESDMPGHRPFGLPENSSSDSPDDGVSELGGKYTGDESQLRVTRGEMIEWVKETYRKNRGKELPGNTNHVLLSELFHVQSSRWSQLAEIHIKDIQVIVGDFMHAGLGYVIQEEGVRWEISQLIHESLDKNARAGRSELERLLEDEKQQPITYNHYYTDNIQKSRQDFLRNSIEKAMREATDHEWNGKLHISNNAVDGQKLLAALQRRINVDMDLQACEEALAGLNAYYNVALKCFVDNVCKQVVERHLIRNLPKVFQPENIIMLSDEETKKIATEPSGNVEKRQELRLLLGTLKHSLDDLRS